MALMHMVHSIERLMDDREGLRAKLLAKRCLRPMHIGGLCPVSQGCVLYLRGGRNVSQGDM